MMIAQDDANLLLPSLIIHNFFSSLLRGSAAPREFFFLPSLRLLGPVPSALLNGREYS